MADYEAIVVGAGPAGCITAYQLAKAGMSVLILERGDVAGAKNVTGGRLYTHSLEQVIPGFASEAPLERKVVREVVSMMTGESCFNVDFYSRHLAEKAEASSHTVLRAGFDAWLAGKAEEAGCDVVAPAHVDHLLREGGKVIGVQAGDEKLTADVVVLADGVNGLLAQQAGLKKELAPHHVAVGVKETLELSASVINDRFNVADGEGMARLFVGEPTRGMVGGGFLYTNKASISLGLVVTVADMAKSPARLPDLMEAFKQHPAIAPLVAGAKLLEYSAHLVPEGGIHMLPTLTADNVLLIGDAAGFCLNLGYTVRGMDYAIASGAVAAQAILEAKAAGDYSNASLARYKTLLEQSVVLKDMNTYKNAPGFIENTPRMFKEYPEMVEAVFRALFTVGPEPSQLAVKKILPLVRNVGLLNLAKDAWRGGKAL